VTPETIPLPVPMVATEVVELVHVPPVTISDRTVVRPAQIVVAPVMGDSGLTVTVLTAIHPAFE
jgi:hypothetical protein